MAREWQPEVPDKIIERFDLEPEEETLEQALARPEREKPKTTADEAKSIVKALMSAPAQSVRMKGKKKASIHLRIEPDLLDWFKALGPGYQARMHQALENYRVEVGE